MRLDQVYVRRYGPLQTDLQLHDDITVIRGPNESGKSLLVEALLKQLADGAAPNPVIDETPEGFVQLESDGESYRLDGDDSFTDHCAERLDREIRPEELRNVFVVRSGDLAFQEGDDFYTHVTDKLTGRRVEDIDEIVDALLAEGRLTETNRNISNRQEYHDARDQVETARSLTRDVESYLDEARESGVGEAEAERLRLHDQEDRLAARIEELEHAEREAEKRERYERLQADTAAIEANIEELDGLPAESALDDIEDRVVEFEEGESRRPELTEHRERNVTLAKWAVGAGVLAFGLLLAFGLPTVGTIVPLAFLAGAWYVWRRANAISDQLADLSVEEEDLLSDARALGLAVEDRSEIRAAIATVRERRDELADEVQGKKAVVKRELGLTSDTASAVVEEAEDALADLAASIDDAVDTNFDVGELSALEAEYETVTAAREELEDELAHHEAQLEEFWRRANGLRFEVFLDEELDLEIQNLDALVELVGRLDDFVASIEDDAEASRVAIEIFEGIQREEKEKTAELFEEGSRSTELFADITDGRYDRVTYDNEANQLQVVKATGETFVPERLSDGTRDQLYLAIRVALGEELLDGLPGFFVMDDAFLTSDPGRLEIQGDLVERLAADGWQVVYLSAKDDAISELSSRCGNDVIELPPLE